MKLSAKRYLHHCSFHSHEESLLPAQSFLAHTSTGRPVYELSSCQRRKSSREMENERVRILVERQKEQILVEVRSTNFKPILIEEVSSGIIESQRREFDHTTAGDEQLRRDQLLLQEQLSEQNRDVRETHIKSLHDMEEWKRVQEFRIDEFSRIRLIEIQDTTNEFTAIIQELQNEVNCMNDSRDFKDAESTQWFIPRSQSTDVISTLSCSWRDAKPSWKNAEPQR